ncbi:MAG TPA: TolC family protein [Vicinamibacterales bacterium]|jgi:multidrug efflux system outer membrane protein|nr:TolC family protein [Vicinamibacterales bacterium]
MRRWLFTVAVSVATASCALGPNYRRPAVAIPSAYRDTTAAVAQEGPASFADVQWFDLFKDDTLTQIVSTALAQNFDLRIAAERVLQARERVRIVRADQLPVVVGSVGASQNRLSEVGVRPLPPGFGPDISDVQAGFGLAWEQVEQLLVAANAQIGAARADYFPRISLTGLLGVESRALSDLLTASAGAWSVGVAAAAPIFNAGRTRASVRLSESVERELVVSYQRTIYRALREVSGALAGYRKTGEQRAQQELLVTALRDAVRLSTDRYQGGLDSYLQVLDAQRSLFRSELDLAALQRLELASIVELYRALGGGWTGQP